MAPAAIRIRYCRRAKKINRMNQALSLALLALGIVLIEGVREFDIMSCHSIACV